eukprot:g25550.t1
MGSVGSSLFLADCVKFKGDLGDVLSDFAPCYGPGLRSKRMEEMMQELFRLQDLNQNGDNEADRPAPLRGARRRTHAVLRMDGDSPECSTLKAYADRHGYAFTLARPEAEPKSWSQRPAESWYRFLDQIFKDRPLNLRTGGIFQWDVRKSGLVSDKVFFIQVNGHGEDLLKAWRLSSSVDEAMRFEAAEQGTLTELLFPGKVVTRSQKALKLFEAVVPWVEEERFDCLTGARFKERLSALNGAVQRWRVPRWRPEAEPHRGQVLMAQKVEVKATTAAPRISLPVLQLPEVKEENLELDHQEIQEELGEPCFTAQAELLKLNEKIAILHGADVAAAQRRFSQIFRSELDPEGRPITFSRFRRYMFRMLDSMDPDEPTQAMIMDQFIAEADLAIATFPKSLKVNAGFMRVQPPVGFDKL